MLKYYTITNEEQLLTAETEYALLRFYDNVKPLPDDYEIGKYVVENGELVRNPDYEAEQELKEKERVAKLFLTGADVERGIYKAKGMDFEDIIDYVTALPIDGLNLKELKIELKANHFYRGNPYVSAIGNMLGFTKEQLDKFFEDGNYEHLLPPEEELPTEEIVLPEEPIEGVENENSTN